MNKTVKTVLIALVLIPVGSYVGRLVGERQAAPYLEGDAGRRADPSAAVTTGITTQASEGVTEADLDQAGLARLEQWIVNTIVEKGALSFKANGLDYDPATYRRSLRPQSVYMQLAGVKFAITKLRPPGVRMVSIIGIRGDQLIRVMCIRKSEEDILVVSGECGRTIERAFNVALPRP